MSVVGMLYNVQLMRFAGENGVAAYGVIMYLNLMVRHQLRLLLMHLEDIHLYLILTIDTNNIQLPERQQQDMIFMMLMII